MNIKITPSSAKGRIGAIASKSVAHRLLICAAFADKETAIYCRELNDDISATAECLASLGAKAERIGEGFIVTPIKELNKNAVLNCNESGSTLRFLLPIVCMLGADPIFVMSGRLPNRPLSPLWELLEKGGAGLEWIEPNKLSCKGKIDETTFSISGSVSSQFISGLMFALAVCRRIGNIKITDKLESESYVEMTAEALRTFGVRVERTEDGYSVDGSDGLVSCERVFVEGDWSNAAFALAMGAIGEDAVTVTGLNTESTQGDKKIVGLLAELGANVEMNSGEITVSRKNLCGINIDASQIPDLVPVLATVASVAKGRTVIYNASRLRLKESDRLMTVKNMLVSLGADISETEDGLVINGKERLDGGRTKSYGDHRIAMSAAVAATVCRKEVIIENAEAVEKSYPDFWKDLRALGIKAKEI